MVDVTRVVKVLILALGLGLAMPGPGWLAGPGGAQARPVHVKKKKKKKKKRKRHKKARRARRAKKPKKTEAPPREPKQSEAPGGADGHQSSSAASAEQPTQDASGSAAARDHAGPVGAEPEAAGPEPQGGTAGPTATSSQGLTPGGGGTGSAPPEGSGAVPAVSPRSGDDEPDVEVIQEPEGTGRSDAGPGPEAGPAPRTPVEPRPARGLAGPKEEDLPPREDVWVFEPQEPIPAPGRPLSRVVYPPQRFRIRMDHASHVKDLEEPCLDCHRSVLGSDEAADWNQPNHLACQQCHISDDPKDIECSQCHREAIPGRPKPDLVPPPRLIFSHRAHLARLLGVDEAGIPEIPPMGPLRERRYGEFAEAWKLPEEVTGFHVSNALCLNCHPNGDSAGVGEAVQLPGMRTRCFDCHDDRLAPRRCDLCHPRAPDAALREGGVGFRELGLVPRSHGPSWLEEHRDEARAADSECLGCHRDSDCVECHRGKVWPSYHPGNYILSHGLWSRDRVLDCRSCHVDEECIQCHRARGVTVDTFPGKWQAIFHPPGWMDARDQGFHGIAGRRDLLSCTSCHREADCTTGGCHR